MHSVNEYLQFTEVENLKVLTSGTLPPNPAKLLVSGKMKSLVQELKTQADILLFDSPPVGMIADSLAFCTILDGVLIVCDVGRTRKSELKQTVEDLGRVHANLIGVVLNRSPRGKGSYYYYYYHNGEKAKRKHDWLRSFNGLRKAKALIPSDHSKQ
jgi:capsular exopolysaccharide synthesis family protein